MLIFPHKVSFRKRNLLEYQVPCFLRYRSSPAAGFSLLEVLVVLAIMGMLLAVMSPHMVSSIESSRFSKYAEIGAGRVSQYRAEAVLNNKAVLIVTSESTPDDVRGGLYLVRDLKLPHDWIVQGDPIFITQSGLCQGGRLRLMSPTRRQALYEFSAPLCKAKRIVMPGGVSGDI